MRICLFTDTLGDLNGVSRFILDMGRQALEHGIDLHIVTSTLKPCPEAPNIHNLRPHFCTRMPFYRELDLVFPSMKRLEEKLIELDPDLLHISTPGPVGFGAKRLASKYMLPVIGTYHTDFPAYIKDNMRIELFKRITDGVMASFYKEFHHVFTRSREYERIMCDDIRIAQTRTSFLKPGTDIRAFHPSRRDDSVFESFDIRSEGLKILYVGRISREKNVPFLLDAFRTLKTQLPNVKMQLILVGEGRFTKWQAKLYPFEIYFLGPVRDERLHALYASSDFFVFPSVTDTLGQVVLEAQASGIPAVVSDRGGPQSIVNFQNRPGGLVVKANDRDAWVDAIRSLVEGPELRRRLGEQGLKNMSAFDIKDSFDHFTSVHLDHFERDNDDD